MFLLACTSSRAQQIPGAVIFHIHSSHTAFPDSGRTKDRLYDGRLYTVAEHYRDSSVLIVAPKKLEAKETVDLVFWFHGSYNDVDKAGIQQGLVEQFVASKRNVVLVFAATAHDAPDSYGGKLEKPGDFKALVGDVLQGLKAQKIISENCTYGHILIGGHSGGYHVIARIVKNGQMPIDEVMLFDALYGDANILMSWLKAGNQHRFVDFFAAGTTAESRAMAKLVDAAGINNFEVEETALVPSQLQEHPIVFIHSLKAHDDIITPANFTLALENSPLLKKL